jgi:threonine synthase
VIGKVIDFIVGREPVASATGIAGVVTAALGVIAALGGDIDPEVVAAVGAFAAALAGWLARKAVSPIGRPEHEEPAL